MTRVDENQDGRRAEDKRAQEKQDEKRSQEKGAEFARLMNAGRRQAKEQARQQQSAGRGAREERSRRGAKSGAKQAASNALLAKHGIRANAFIETLHREGNERLVSNRDDRGERGEELGRARERRAVARGAREEATQARRDQNDKLAAIGRDDRDRSGQGDGRSGHGDASGQSSHDAQVTAQAPTGMVHGAQGSFGVAHAAGAGGAAHTTPDTQRMMNELVKRIMAGVDQKGFGVMHIELSDHVFGGAQVTLKAEDAGISLAFRTHDDAAAGLLGAGQTARELHGALARRGIRLQALEVNGRKVIRSAADAE